MGFLEKFMRSITSSHHDKHGGSDYSGRHGGKHHDRGDNYSRHAAAPAPSSATKACSDCVEHRAFRTPAIALSVDWLSTLFAARDAKPSWHSA